MLLAVAGLLILCLTCLYIAWRFTMPAIVMYAVAGLVLGPIWGLMNPPAQLGDFYFALISIAVAIILFEGGLHLSWKELRESKSGVGRILLVSTPLNVAFNAAAAHYVAGLDWGVAVVLAALFIITGPTVVMPLLQQTKIKPKVASILKWEAIVNDPIGALLCVFAFEYIVHYQPVGDVVMNTTRFGFSILLVAGVSVLAAWLLKHAFNRGSVPEYLKQPMILTLVIALFALADLVQEEGGLVAVTAFGLALANMRFASYHDTKRFKEYIAILLIGIIFILISASLRLSDMAAFDFGALGFLFLAIFVNRPVAVLISTLGSNLNWKERLFVGWIAPRGIVCAVTAGLIGPKLLDAGFDNGAYVLPITFGMIFGTVLLHGFSIRWIANRFGLATHAHGVLIVGSNPFTVALGQAFQRLKMPVVVCDTGWQQLRLARMADLPVHYGEVLSEQSYYNLELEQYSYAVLATDNAAYNTLVASTYVHHFGRHRIHKVRTGPEPGNARTQYAHNLAGSLLGEHTLDELNEKIQEGWKLKTINIGADYTLDAFEASTDERLPLFYATSSGHLKSAISAFSKRDREEEITLIAMVKEDPEKVAAKARARRQLSDSETPVTG